VTAHLEEQEVPRRVFISYGHDESATLAEKLKQDLESKGHEVWFDSHRLKTGSDWGRDIEQGLEWVSEIPGEGRFVLLMTPHSVRRPDGYCLRELRRALDRKLVVLPLMVVRCEPPLCICRIQWLDMEDCLPLPERESRYQVKLARLLEALQHDSDFEGVQGRLLRRLQPLSFEAEIQQHIARFTGRRQIINRIAGWLAESDVSRVFWVIGRPGIGKTALACWLCLNCPQVGGFHLCRHGHVEKSDPRRAILSVVFQLSSQLPDYQEHLNSLNLEELVANDNAKSLFDNLVVQPLSTSFPKPTSNVAILIDALDEATIHGQNELADLIGSEFERTPQWVRLILTSRDNEPAVTNPLQSLRPYVFDASYPENENDLREYLARELRPFAEHKKVPADLIDSVIDKSEGLFLYAEWIRRELQQGRLDLRRIDQFPQGLGGIYVQFFNRQFPDLDVFRNVFRPVLETIAAAQEPLNMQYLRALFSWSAYDEGELEYNFGSLFPVSEGRIQAFHLSALEWLCDKNKALRYFVSVQEGHRCLAAHGWKQIVDAYGLETGLSEGVPEPGIRNLQDAYDLRYLTEHLEGADRVQDLHRLLRFERTVGEQRQNLWYAVKASNGQLNGYMHDLEQAWRQAKITNDVGLQVRYALCLSSVRHVGNVPSPTLELALKYEVLTWQQAIDFAQLQRELPERAKALCRLASFLPDGERARALTDAFDIARANKYGEILISLLPHLSEPLLNDALELARTIENEETRAKLLSGLVGRLPGKSLDAVIEIAESIEDDLSYVGVLRSVGSRLSGTQRDKILAEIKAIVRAMPLDAVKAQALIEIAKSERGVQRIKTLDRALRIARKIDYSNDLAVALRALATHDLTSKQIAEALGIAAKTYAEEDHPGTEEAYISVLYVFAPLLSSDQRADIVGEFVSRWQSDSRLDRVSILASYLPQEKQIELFPKLVPYLIRRAESMELGFLPSRRRTLTTGDWKRAAALTVLSKIPEEILESALVSANQIYNDDDRADILYALVPRLRPDRRKEVLRAEVKRVTAIGDTEAPTHALASLVKYMPADQRAELAETVLNAAQTMGEDRFAATAKIAPYLEGKRGDKAVQQAFSAIRDLKDSRASRNALTALAPVLPRSSISEALKIAGELDPTDYPALAALVPRLPMDQRHEVIDNCLNAAQGWVAAELPSDFVEALKAIAPYMDKSQLATALKVSINLREQLADALAVLGPRLSEQQIDEALKMMLADDLSWRDDHRARALAVLAKHLRGNNRTNALSEALKALDDPHVFGTLALPKPASQLMEDQRIEALSEALVRAKGIDEDNRRAETLSALLPSLSGAEQLDALQQVLESCMGTMVVLTFGGTQIRQSIDRKFLLDQIARMAKTLSDMPGENVVMETVSAIRDTTAWWA
jgi:hypothetical protein